MQLGSYSLQWIGNEHGTLPNGKLQTSCTSRALQQMHTTITSPNIDDSGTFPVHKLCSDFSSTARNPETRPPCSVMALHNRLHIPNPPTLIFTLSPGQRRHFDHSPAITSYSLVSPITLCHHQQIVGNIIRQQHVDPKLDVIEMTQHGISSCRIRLTQLKIIGHITQSMQPLRTITRH